MANDKFKINGHKLVYHIPHLYEWIKGENIYPIYVEIGLYGECNHRCIFCAFDFFTSGTLETACLKKFVKQAAKKKVKAILYSGEGEPLLHNNSTNIVRFTKRIGIDVALSTNGVMLDKRESEKILGCLTWLRVSLNAGSPKTYAFIHGTKKKDFNTVIDNIKEAVKIKDRNKYSCTIGVQFLLIPQNYKEVANLVNILNDLGVDYLVVKPYSYHPSSINKINYDFNYKNLFYLEEKLTKYSKGNFQVIFRRHAMEKINRKKPYERCLSLPFATHVTSKGDIYPCNFFVGKKDFSFGNICEETFEEIWEGDRRNRIMDRIHTKWNVEDCRDACRFDEINRYLWDLKNPVDHVNFI